MKDAARITSVDALNRFKAALAEFTDNARLALRNADGDVSRLRWWVEREQAEHWKRQLKVRQRKLAEAKSELYRAKLQSSDSRASTVIERKAVERAEHAIREAEHKLERVKYWTRTIDREMMIFRGQTSSLGGMLERDMPKAIARLNRMMDALEKYVKLQAPTDGAAGAPSAGPTSNEDDDDAEATP